MKEYLKTQWAYWSIAIAVTVLGILWLLHNGPTPVIRITTPLDENAPFLYMLSAFPFLGILIGELVTVIAQDGMRRQAIDIIIAVILLVLISHLRLALRLPISGHVFLLSYFILRRGFIHNTTIPSRRPELWVAIIIFLIIVYVKLAWWTDPVTLGVGILAGAVLFGCSKLMHQPQQKAIKGEMK